MESLPVTLADIASQQGWSATDIAFMSGVDKSTISRIWSEERWIEHVRGYTLQALMNTVPGVSEMVSSDYAGRRIKEYSHNLQEHGLEVSAERLITLRKYISDPNIIYLLHTLEAIVTKSERKLIKLLPKFWDIEADRALSYVFGNYGLIENKQFFQQKCIERFHDLSIKQPSFFKDIACMTLAHHLMKVGYHSEYLDEQINTKKRGFEFRSYTVAQIINSDDSDIYYQYKKVFNTDPLQMQIERYAYLSYCANFQISANFLVPKNVNLDRSAMFFINELKQANATYTQYLLEIQLPILLGIDKTFGNKFQFLIFTLQSIQSRWEAESYIYKLIYSNLYQLCSKE